MSKNSARTDPATKEVLRYGEALWDGYSELKKRGLLSTNLFVELVQIIKEDTACIRKLPGTVIQNARTGATVFTPPAGESVIREKLKSLEEYTHADNGTNPLITLAVIHCQCEAVHPFSDGNGRRGSTFNVDAYDRSAAIMFQDGRELDARNIMASQDSTRFLNEKTEAASVVPTHTIKKVVVTNHGVGFLEGLGWGAGIGIVSGATLGLIGSTSKYSGSTGEDVAWATLTLGAVGGAVGGFIGGIWGVIAGHSYEYEFPLTKGREQ